MPLFFFDFTSNGVIARDDVGVDFPSLEEAYLETSRAALDMCFEKFRHRGDPYRDAFDILDNERRALMHVPFSEVLRIRNVGWPEVRGQSNDALRRNMARGHALCADVQSELQKAESLLLKMRGHLARLKSLEL